MEASYWSRSLESDATVRADYALTTTTLTPRYAARNSDDILTVVEFVAVTGDDLERGTSRESVLELVPHTLAVLAAVAQLDHQRHRR